MQLPPISVLVNWPIPNYDNPHTQGKSLIIVNVIFMTLISFAVPLRLIGRYKNKGRVGWDDANMALAYIFAMALGVVAMLGNVRFQWNRHMWDVEFNMFSAASKIGMLSKIFFVLASTFTRSSLICFYYQLIQDTGYTLYQWVLRGAFVFNAATGIAFFFLALFFCIPVEAYWIFPIMENAKCLDEASATLAVGVISCIADLLVTLLPIPIILRLNMPWKHRTGVCVLLSLGLIVTIAGVVRTYYIWRTFRDPFDETWNSMPLYICATVEIDLAILCGCAPALKPLFSTVLSRVTEMISIQSLAISQRTSSHPAEGNRIPMRTTAPGRRHRIDNDELDNSQHTICIPTFYSSVSARTPPRAFSTTSSQKTMLAHLQASTSSSWDAEPDCKGGDIAPEIPFVFRQHDPDTDVEKANHNTD